jgi:hypothetical protein
VYKRSCFAASLPGFVVVIALIMVVLTGVRGNLSVVLICISFITGEVDYQSNKTTERNERDSNRKQEIK